MYIILAHLYIFHHHKSEAWIYLFIFHTLHILYTNYWSSFLISFNCHLFCIFQNLSWAFTELKSNVVALYNLFYSIPFHSIPRILLNDKKTRLFMPLLLNGTKENKHSQRASSWKKSLVCTLNFWCITVSFEGPIHQICTVSFGNSTIMASLKLFFFFFYSLCPQVGKLTSR